MHHLLKVFLQILRLRKGPQELPASELLLGIVLGLHFLFGMTLLAFHRPFGISVLGAALDTGMVALVVKATLALRGLPHRFLQTATALAGSDFLLAFPLLPLEVWQHDDLTSVVSLLLTGWGLVVFGHIFRHALELPHWKGFAVAVGYFLVSLAVVDLMVGPGV